MPVNPSSHGRSPARKPTTRRPARASLRGAVVEVFRRAILDAAEKVFRDQGFADAKMARIAQQAGMAAGTLYNYFDSKESIFRALIDQRADQFLASLQALAQQAPGPRQRLLAITRATFEYMETHTPMCMLFEQLGPHSAMAMRRACGPGVERMRARFLGLVEGVLGEARRGGLLRADVGLGDATLVFTGSVYGLLSGWVFAGRKGRLRDRAAMLVDLFLEGAGTKS
jgi:AcrR family transcriptional regulator